MGDESAATWMILAVGGIVAACVLLKGLLRRLGVPELIGYLALGWRKGLLIGGSMIPRAEVAMIVMLYGLGAGEQAVPARVFSAMVFVSAATCTLSPLAAHWSLRRWPPRTEETEASPGGMVTPDDSSG